MALDFKNILRIPPSIAILAAVVLAPTTTCFSYYTLAKLADGEGILRAMIPLAYPFAIIGFVGLAAVLSSAKKSKPLLWLASACIVIPAAFLLIVRR